MSSIDRSRASCSRFLSSFNADVRIRHQIGALVATAIDYAVMILTVSFFRALPAIGTALGAASGGCANFLLGRFWIFPATGGTTEAQAGKYVLISLSSLLFNTAGVHILTRRCGVQYIAARLLVSTFVSIFWNYPMHRSFVFRTRLP